MRKKILFYGNCHLGVLANFFDQFLSDKYEVIKCEEAGLIPFFGYGVFAVWSPENRKNEKLFYKNVIKLIEESDIFVFNEIGNRECEELNTNYILKNVVKNGKFCISNNRFSGYLNGPDSVQNMIDYVKQKIGIFERTDIISYLYNEVDENLIKMIEKEALECLLKNKKRENDQKERHKPCFIEINDFIEKEYKNKLLFLSHNHPSIFYYEELLSRLLSRLGENLNQEDIKNFKITSYMGGVNTFKMNFFKKYFGEIELPYGPYEAWDLVRNTKI
jgi:hypothetical protein